MGGKTAAPSGTWRSGSSAISAPRHGGNDAHLVAGLDGGGEAVEVANVLVVEVDVDEAAHLAVVEQPLRDAGELAAHVVEHGLHRRAAGLDDRLLVGVLA